jgi:methionyl-tRNA synthetase
MRETIGVFVAWPYANGDLHLGHLAGALLPADIFARYHRLRGDHVLMVSGSDSHGTPITVAAEQLGVSPLAFFSRYHRRFLDDFQRFGISYDLYTHTHTENHAAVSQDLFKRLYESGYIALDTMQQLYCETDRRFLPDRYVEGACPHCGYQPARGDQCDNCGRTYDATDLLEPRCRICGNPPVVREAEHFFLDLPALEADLRDFTERQEHWRPNVRNFVRTFLAEGLKRRPVSRDIEWGVPLPVPGYEQNVMYVWFEAVIGYLSASVEWARNRGTPDEWRRWWYEPEARGYYFIGKDNIPFHAIIWPAELMGYDRAMTLPYDIPANEFLNLEGRQFSTSRNWAVWLPDYLERFDPDPLRYYLTSIAPETRDSEFTWQGFVDHNNNELVAAWGNLVNRMVSFAHRHWDGRVPEPGPLEGRDRELLDTIAAGFDAAGARYGRAEARGALHESMGLAREVNRYLDEKAPWFQIRDDREAAATTVFVALQAIDSLKILLAPVLPFTSARIHRTLGYDAPLFGEIAIERVGETAHEYDTVTYHPAPDEGNIDRWRPSDLQPGAPLERGGVLFSKLEQSVVEDERRRLIEQSGVAE